MATSAPFPSKKVAPAARGSSFDPAAAQAFGAVIRDLREAQGIAQDKFAYQANVDRSYYGKLERGERQPSLGLIFRIAAGLNVSGAHLVEQSERRIRGDRT